MLSPTQWDNATPSVRVDDLDKALDDMPAEMRRRFEWAVNVALVVAEHFELDDLDDVDTALVNMKADLRYEARIEYLNKEEELDDEIKALRKRIAELEARAA